MMSRRLWTTGTAVAASVVMGCATSGDSMQHGHADAMSPDGEQCYQFERNDAADRLGLPWGFVRTHTMLDEGGELRRHVAYTLSGPSSRADFPFARWWHAEGMMRLGPEITGSLDLALRMDGRRLIGSGRFIGDARPAGGDIDRSPVEGVVAHQVLCGADPGGI